MRTCTATNNEDLVTHISTVALEIPPSERGYFLKIYGEINHTNIFHRDNRGYRRIGFSISYFFINIPISLTKHVGGSQETLLYISPIANNTVLCNSALLMDCSKFLVPQPVRAYKLQLGFDVLTSHFMAVVSFRVRIHLHFINLNFLSEGPSNIFVSEFKRLSIQT
jgi:hypothetical protein